MESTGVSQSFNDGSVHHDAGECDVIGIHIVASVALIVIAMVKRHRERRRRRHGGSRPGKQLNRDYGRHEGGIRLDRDYFCRLRTHQGLRPTFIETEF
jgi:hypothetical protein